MDKMNKKTQVFINNIDKAIIGKADRGYVYIHKDVFLGKEEEDLMPKSKTYLPIIKEFKTKDLKMFTELTRLEDEYDWADWGVGRYYFKDKLPGPTTQTENFGFTDEFAKEIGYNPGIYEEKGVVVDKTTENTIIFKYEKKNSDYAFFLFDSFIMRHVGTEFITIHTDCELEDSLDLYRLIKSKTEIKVTLSPEDFLQMRDIVIRFID